MQINELYLYLQFLNMKLSCCSPWRIVSASYMVCNNALKQVQGDKTITRKRSSFNRENFLLKTLYFHCLSMPKMAIL